MSLSSTAKYLIAIVLVAWIGVLALLISLRPMAETRFSTAGALEQAVASVASGQGIVGLVPQDLYGEEWIAAAIVCPYATEEGIARNLDVDASELELGGAGVPEDTNYLLLRSADGGHAFDRIDRADIDLCTVPLGQYIDSRAMLPLGKTEQGGWALLN
ncbi:MAG: hypothetical protein GX859_02880 [Corynebacterium humireducens]|uniref:Uncharacterized protein n=2 Tax=Corynebacterium humireducens TaxID=1223514 RepID=A0A0B5D7N4_9CORY|nr:hypothetical protein [Corynebacterium humireducens]AJE32283.1 hypothetical protein B842_02150 [Corynebacterium humireducens NBRC 106098 = DSM 45392]NLA55236.1 hypothetical protein [Corynebacterium humireducens]